MNIQQAIISGIKEQLFFNDYLVLPGFGGFVLKSRPAHFSATGGLLHPPSKTVTFNAQLRQNDGILASWLQERLKCSAPEALEHLGDFSEFCKGILQAKRRLSLDGIGFFYLDFENNVCFEPQQDANFLAAAFGLSPVTLTIPEPLVAQPVPEKTMTVTDREAPLPDTAPTLPSRRRYSRMVTPVLLAVICFSLLGLLVSNASMKGELKSSLFGGHTATAYTPAGYPELALSESTSPPAAYVADVNGIACVELDGHTLPVNVASHKLNQTLVNYSSSGIKSSRQAHEVVLGCFTVLDNARRMVTKLSQRKIRASVQGKNKKGMYVVSYGSYASKEDALQKLQEVKDLFPNAWIMSE
jgi:hypothetical protein